MKRLIALMTLVLLVAVAWAQESMFKIRIDGKTFLNTRPFFTAAIRDGYVMKNSSVYVDRDTSATLYYSEVRTSPTLFLEARLVATEEPISIPILLDGNLLVVPHTTAYDRFTTASVIKDEYVIDLDEHKEYKFEYISIEKE